MSPPRNKRRYHHGDLASGLVREAIALTAEKGLAGWSISEAAKRLGVSTAAPYRHFPNRAALLDAVAVAGLERLRGDLIAAFESEGAPLDQFHAVGFVPVDFALDASAHYAITFSGVRPNTLEQLTTAGPETAFGALRDMTEQWQAAGFLAPTDPTALSMTIWATGHGVASLLASGRLDLGPRSKMREFTRQVMGSLLNGIAVAPMPSH